MQALKKPYDIHQLENGSIISPKGFAADGVHAGLRYAKKDLGIIFSEVPAQSAAVYTTNVFQAAPLKVTQESLAQEHKLQAVLVNSACANACTGNRGLLDAYQTREWVAKKFGIPDHYVAVASTGVIGEYLEMEKMKKGIQMLKPAASKEHSNSFETSILTTDLVTKSCGVETTIDGKKVTIGGAAKGSGMIKPNMATMLAFVTTDAAVEDGYVKQALKEITDDTFNQITVDGDTSTNDMVLVLANGLAGNNPLSPEHSEWQKFLAAFKMVCEDLAKKIARDGEGATKLVEVNVEGAANDEEARKIAKTVVGSSLVKTAVYGNDANWGRVVCAVGYSEATVLPDQIDIAIGPYWILKNSEVQAYSEEDVTEYLKNETVVIHIHLNVGNGTGTAWGCDLTYDYVKINASYRT
ncbi:bifunctional glutamate N-acetyltransferase/amino-acid acetyltransferase ArgJ [Bacillus smithii]|jgi:glutamate N-acetyltransferase/amino-acid N-acetyltransferase|uniref:bifunctional glutamate N-acetyltransferase/amino-acid acetyltransferase ArgJ n=1 Tax=Bacillus smithii TaxID=1479 RepID=UPI003D20FA1E